MARAYTFFFDSGSSALSPPTSERLGALLDQIRRIPVARIEITGHTDDQEDRVSDVELSLRRAETVREYLLKAGVDGTLTSVKAVRAKQPMVVASGPEPANRYVLVFLK